MRKNAGTELDSYLLNRREGLILVPAALAALFIGRRAEAGPFEGIFGRSAKSLTERLAHPTTSLRISDAGDGTYLIHTTSLPDHEIGKFPNEYLPFDVIPSPKFLHIAKAPKAAAESTPIQDWLFGVGLNGVYFDPSGPYWKAQDSGWQFENMAPLVRLYLSLDMNNGHVQPNGAYHYHGNPDRLQRRLEALVGAGKMCLLGFAADGFPIYTASGYQMPMDPSSPVLELRSSYRLRSGTRPRESAPGLLATGSSTRNYAYDGSFIEDHVYTAGSGDLDECNGRFGVTPEYPEGTYYYCITSVFPCEIFRMSWQGRIN